MGQAREGRPDVEEEDRGILGLGDGVRLAEALNVNDVVRDGPAADEASLPRVDGDLGNLGQWPVDRDCKKLARRVGEADGPRHARGPRDGAPVARLIAFRDEDEQALVEVGGERVAVHEGNVGVVQHVHQVGAGEPPC